MNNNLSNATEKRDFYALSECVNCQTTKGFLDTIQTDDGQTLLVCEECGDAIRQEEAKADELAALPSCDARQQIIDTATSTGNVVNRLKAHDLECRCSERKQPRLEPAQAALFQGVA
jgi:hypothetical protein